MIAPVLEFINCVYFLLWCVPDFSVYTGGLLAAVFCHSSNGENFAAVRVTHGSRRATTKDENGPRHLCFVFNAIGSYFHRSGSAGVARLAPCPICLPSPQLRDTHLESTNVTVDDRPVDGIPFRRFA